MTTTNIVSQANGSDLAEMIAKLQAENAKLKDKLQSKGTISFKVTDKGGVSAYGLGRFPVTLYLSQWERLIKAVPALEVFLAENVDKLATKD